MEKLLTGGIYDLGISEKYASTCLVIDQDEETIILHNPSQYFNRNFKEHLEFEDAIKIGIKENFISLNKSQFLILNKSDLQVDVFGYLGKINEELLEQLKTFIKGKLEPTFDNLKFY